MKVFKALWAPFVCSLRCCRHVCLQIAFKYSRCWERKCVFSNRTTFQSFKTWTWVSYITGNAFTILKIELVSDGPALARWLSKSFYHTSLITGIQLPELKGKGFFSKSCPLTPTQAPAICPWAYEHSQTPTT